MTDYNPRLILFLSHFKIGLHTDCFGLYADIVGLGNGFSVYKPYFITEYNEIRSIPIDIKICYICKPLNIFLK